MLAVLQRPECSFQTYIGSERRQTTRFTVTGFDTDGRPPETIRLRPFATEWMVNPQLPYQSSPLSVSTTPSERPVHSLYSISISNSDSARATVLVIISSTSIVP